ncbi:hypothetical protein MtrunA17_Chr6g0465921 [Medicago truncatula]|uniref:Uncharacterized protein n=1 Tax=Medicago truncatula TaxID=3880 RepID=A0A396HF24_MEDTR|nr:hypothetical protein MtrunA17_Chr6g0465921 [Medicago truncatula]
MVEMKCEFCIVLVIVLILLLLCFMVECLFCVGYCFQTTISKGKSVSDACRRMAARHVDVVLLTDANALLFGMLCYSE